MDQAIKAMAEREGKYLTFSLAGEEYGSGILKIREIIGMMPITSIPQSPVM
jgi:purine-binding chemotaxis protein CheW